MTGRDGFPPFAYIVILRNCASLHSCMRSWPLLTGASVLRAGYVCPKSVHSGSLHEATRSCEVDWPGPGHGDPDPYARLRETGTILRPRQCIPVRTLSRSQSRQSQSRRIHPLVIDFVSTSTKIGRLLHSIGVRAVLFASHRAEHHTKQRRAEQSLRARDAR